MPNINRAVFATSTIERTRYLNENWQEFWKHLRIKREHNKRRNNERDKLRKLALELEALPAINPVPYRVSVPATLDSRCTALLEAYRPYSEAMKARPYDGDKVQALGMAFCQVFNANKEFICMLLGVPLEPKKDEEGFSYALNRKAMKVIEFRKDLI